MQRGCGGVGGCGGVTMRGIHAWWRGGSWASGQHFRARFYGLEGGKEKKGEKCLELETGENKQEFQKNFCIIIVYYYMYYYMYILYVLL